MQNEIACWGRSSMGEHLPCMPDLGSIPSTVKRKEGLVPQQCLLSSATVEWETKLAYQVDHCSLNYIDSSSMECPRETAAWSILNTEELEPNGPRRAKLLLSLWGFLLSQELDLLTSLGPGKLTHAFPQKHFLPHSSHFLHLTSAYFLPHFDQPCPTAGENRTTTLQGMGKILSLVIFEIYTGVS